MCVNVSPYQRSTNSPPPIGLQDVGHIPGFYAPFGPFSLIGVVIPTNWWNPGLAHTFTNRQSRMYSSLFYFCANSKADISLFHVDMLTKPSSVSKGDAQNNAYHANPHWRTNVVLVFTARLPPNIGRKLRVAKARASLKRSPVSLVAIASIQNIVNCSI